MNIVNISQYKEIDKILSPYIVIMLIIYSMMNLIEFLFIDKIDNLSILLKIVYFI